MENKETLYPLTIIADRYLGTYSKGSFIAWNLDFYNIPKDIDAGDITCGMFWNNIKNELEVLSYKHKYKVQVGLGSDPEEAINDLMQKLNFTKDA